MNEHLIINILALDVIYFLFAYAQKLDDHSDYLLHQ